MRLYYATRDGHSRRIAEHIARKLGEIGVAAAPADLAAAPLPPLDLMPGEPVVIIAAIRYGFHLPEASRFLSDFRKLRLSNPLAVLSVNLTARKPGKRSAEGNVYLRRWLRRHRLQPALAEAIAGRLDYPLYNRFDRLAIQFIMTLTRGPTDASKSFEFTDWKQVDGIAEKLAEMTVRTTLDCN